LEKRVSAVCEILNFTAGTINEINSAPALLADVADWSIRRAVSGLVTQLRFKPYYDFHVLKYLYTGNIMGTTPTKDDVARADLSLAYNVLYRNYWLSKVSSKPYKKNYLLTPTVWKNTLGNDWGRATKILKEDGFEKEFMQDMLPLIGLMNPFLFPLVPHLQAKLFDVPVASPLSAFTGMEDTLMGVSRELNNPNYFYAWLENLLALLPILDPRRFPAKYKGFVDENYPNAIQTAAGSVQLIDKPFALTTKHDASGLHYTYSNGNITLLKLDVGLRDFRVYLNGGKTQFTRDLPKLSEPFFVDEAQDYLSLVDTHDQLNIKQKVSNPQHQIYNSLVEKNLKEIDIDVTKYSLASLIKYSFVQSSDRMEATFKRNLEYADEHVANFFFLPYTKAATVKKGDYTKEMGINQLRLNLKALGNPIPPVALFFKRSDNLFSDVFFEDSAAREVGKVMDKVDGAMTNFYKNFTDGKVHDPKAIAKLLARGSNDPKVFYEAQKSISSKISANWLSSRTLNETEQKAMAASVKEVTNEQ